MRKVRNQNNIDRNSSVFARLKPKVRHNVQIRKVRFQKKWLTRIYIFIGLLFAVAILLFAVRILLNKAFPSDKGPIIRPVVVLQFGTDQLEKLLNDANINVDEIRLSSTSGGLTAKIERGPRVYFSNNEDLALQVASLDKILTRLIISGEKAVSIDFREDRPLVKF